MSFTHKKRSVQMDDIYRLHLTVTGAYAYRARVDYKNPGQSSWKRSDNLANVSVGISKEVYLKDVSGIREGATVRFVMDIRAGKTIVASETFTYRKDSDYYASYNGTGTTLKAKAVYKGRFATVVYSGEASALFLKVSGTYAYNAKIQYRKGSYTPWKTTGHIVNVTAGIPEMVNISEVGGISPGDHFRFVMDIVAGNKNVIANEYFVYKKDITTIAKYDCKGTTLNCSIKYNGLAAYSPVDFICDGVDRQEAYRNYSIYSSTSTGLPIGGCVRIKNHSLADVMKFVNDGRIASIVSEKSGSKTRITTYASGPKKTGEGHIWFMDKNYDCYEEDVILHGDLSKEQTTSYSSSNPNIIYISWNDKALGGDPFLRSITAKGQFADFFKLFGFVSGLQNGRRVYHTIVDCIQRKFGYCDLYDEAFNYGTNMMREKFEFTSQGQRYIFWTWKGHYLNLGAGAEMGFYRFVKRMSLKDLTDKIMQGVNDFFKEYARFALPKLPLTEAVIKASIKKTLSLVATKSYYDYYESDDKTPVMPMTLTIKGKGTLPNQICRYAPREPQWWITSFVPQLQGVNPKDTVAEYTVQFNQSQKQLFDDFMKVRFPNWSGDRNKLTLVHTF